MKTRLIPSLGKEKAAALQRRMTEHAVWMARKISERRGSAIEIHYQGGSEEKVAHWLQKDGCIVHRQRQGTLGEKMLHAVSGALAGGYEYIIIIGADCPCLTDKILEEALLALRTSDVVLGPAHDGGFYLIGMKKVHQALFDNIQWGGESVLAAALANAEKLHLSTYQLRSLPDIDRPEDLVYLENLGWDLFKKEEKGPC